MKLSDIKTASPDLSDLEHLFDPNRKPMFVGKPEGWWQEHGHLLAERPAGVLLQDSRGLIGTVLELQRDDYWRQFSDDWEQFCLDIFNLPAAGIEQVAQFLRVTHETKPASTEVQR